MGLRSYIINAATPRQRFHAGLAMAIALTSALVLIFVPRSPDTARALQTIQPGMSYQEARAILLQPHLAGPLAESFTSPVKEAQAVLRGDPSFEKQEWGRVDNSSQYEPEWARAWKKQNGLALSTAERRMYTVLQWGIANTQSYSFIAIFDENEVLVGRYVTVPSESKFRGWLRRLLGL
jgi:hypothetical protein